jgi:hypothetical protein
MYDLFIENYQTFQREKYKRKPKWERYHVHILKDSIYMAVLPTFIHSQCSITDYFEFSQKLQDKN